MSVNSGASSVLIVDDDVAFVWWLGEVFTAAGYQSVPALHCRQALSLSKKLDLRVDLIAVNPQLPGVLRMLEAFAAARPGLKVILIQDHNSEPSAAIHGDATLQRPSGWEPVLRPQWQRKLRRILESLGAAAPR